MGLPVVSEHKARAKRVNEASEQLGETVPDENIGGEVGGLGQKTEIPRSAFWGLPRTRGEGRRGQMSKVIGVRPDKLRLGYQLRL